MDVWQSVFAFSFGWGYILLGIWAALIYRTLLTGLNVEVRAAYLMCISLVALILATGSWTVPLYYLSIIAVLCGFARLRSSFSRSYLLVLVLLVLNLAFIKYTNLYAEICAICFDPNLPLLGIVGISYTTFKAIDFVIEVNRNRISADISPLQVGAYILFFPTLSQGPINRSFDFMGDLKKNEPFAFTDVVASDVIRLSSGIIKAVLIGKIFFYLSPLYPPTIEQAAGDPLRILISLYCLYLYIYVEFSGVSDIAIVLGKWFGFRIPENFRFPIMANSMPDFWNRWHISLSHWCRDHIFFNILRWFSVNKIKMFKYADFIIATMITFIAIGMWHGDTISWFLYGTLHGLGVVVATIFRTETSRRVPAYQSLSKTWWAQAVGIFLTFNYVSLCLMLVLGPQTLRQLFAVWL